MQLTAPIWFFLLCCCFYFQGSWGQNTGQYYYQDNDGDFFGTSNVSNGDLITARSEWIRIGNNNLPGIPYLVHIVNNVAYGIWPPPGFVANNLDCDDTDANVKPNNIWYKDEDGDGIGGSISLEDCYAPNGYVSTTGDDCDTNNSTFVDFTWYQDADGDGIGSSNSQQACYAPPGYVSSTGDACDTNSSTLVELTWYYDADGDGYAGNASTTLACNPPAHYYASPEDCDDDDPLIHPLSVWFLDGDNDGFGSDTYVIGCEAPLNHVSNTFDLDDTNACITDSTPINYYEDLDGDGYGNPLVSQLCSNPPHTETVSWVIDNSDCDDNNQNIHPGTVWYPDGDGDGYGDPTRSGINQCTPPPGYVNNRADFDDSAACIINIAPQNFYFDGDGDGYGTLSDSRFCSTRALANQGVTQGTYVPNLGDCDDDDPLQHDFTRWYIDQDGDGKGFNPTLLGITNSLRASPTQNLPPSGVVTTTQGCLSSTASYVLNSDDYDDLDLLITEVIPQYYYRDTDGDGYGTATPFLFQSDAPAGYVPNQDDCDDSNALLHPNTVWYLDSDGDGWGSDTALVQCQAPTAYVSNTLDHDDTTQHITNIAPQTFYRDADEDGYGTVSDTLFYSEQPSGYITDNTDCDDSNAQINPLTLWYLDSDDDGFGTRSTLATATTRQCTPPVGYVSRNDDYDDSTIHIINIAPQNFYQDADEDGYGNPNVFLYYSLRPTGYVTNNLDCNDLDQFVNPQKIWYQDTDGDGLGNPLVTTTACTTPTGYIDNNGDLSDTNQYITNIATRTFYYDHDGDGFGDPNNTGGYSFAPPGYTIDNNDCNDNDNSLHPNTLWYFDSDGDGYGGSITYTGCVPPAAYVRNSSDLDDNNPYITNIPGTHFYRDKDQDGYGDPNEDFFASYLPTGYVNNARDCNDQDASLHPNTQWYADLDNDGYGGAPAYVGCSAPGNQVRQADDYDDSTEHIINIPPRHFYQDSDGDQFGNPAVSLYYSLQPPGYVDNDLDCNDKDAQQHPNTVWYEDSDGDHYGNPQSRLQQCEQPTGHVRNPWDLDDSNPYITNIAPVNFYRDQDEDGFGTLQDILFYSILPEGYVVVAGDCDDQDPLLHPNTHWYTDEDQDGFGGENFIKSCLTPTGYVSNTLDLDDTTEYITDQATQVYYYDADGDGFGVSSPTYNFSFLVPGYVTTPGDCDDENTYVHALTLWYFDGDGDGFGQDHISLEQCEQPIGYALYGGDCDDQNPNKVPGASCIPIELFDPEEEFEAGTNLTGKVYADRDLDGFGDPEEAFSLNEIENILVAWVNDDEDACPEAYGEFYGCPEPLVLKTQFAGAHNQIIRLFEQDSIAPDITETKEAMAQISDVQITNVQTYPNPTEGLFHAVWNFPIQDFMGRIAVYTYPELLLIEDFPFTQQPMAAQLDFNGLDPGIYFVQFYFIDGRTLTRRIVKR